jgi:hypothetical protein
MVKKHERSNLVAVINDESLLKFFGDTVNVISKLDSLYKKLSAFEDGDLDDSEMYDELDDFQIKVDSINLLAGVFPSTEDTLNKYFKRTNSILIMFQENVYSITDKGIYPTIGEAGILKNEIFDIIGGLSYFLVYDFGIAKTVREALTVGDYDIDEIFDSYLKSTNSKVEDFGNYILRKFDAYKFHLDFFDEYPELEEEFEWLCFSRMVYYRRW